MAQKVAIRAVAQAAALFKEEDIFSLQGPEWAPSASTGPVRLLEAAQGALFVATARGQLLRLGTAGGDYEELELPRANSHLCGFQLVLLLFDIAVRRLRSRARQRQPESARF